MTNHLSANVNIYSDVVIVVEKHDFLLHRAILWARCQWFRALLGERWQKGGEVQQRINVGAISADVFAVLVEFLYTEYVVQPFLATVISSSSLRRSQRCFLSCFVIQVPLSVHVTDFF